MITLHNRKIWLNSNINIHKMPCVFSQTISYPLIQIRFLICCRYDRMLSEMLGHLERQPLNKERRVAWLTLIGPVFYAMGLFLLAHFRRLFSLFFQWMHSDDDKTVLLVRKNFVVMCNTLNYSLE